MNKNSKMLARFVNYCEAHPEQRFFQALRNWIRKDINARWNFVYVAPVEDQLDIEDTFYWGNEKLIDHEGDHTTD